jgi:hypothetical protein
MNQKKTVESVIFPQYVAEKSVEFNMQLLQWTEQNAVSSIEWYQRKRGKKRLGSILTRTIAIALAGIGAICPLIEAALGKEWNLGNWGYVLIALAGVVFWVDRFLGFSTGWMRYIMAEMTLQRNLKQFQFQWTALQLDQSVPDKLPKLIELSNKFVDQVDAIVIDETTAWVSEFQSNLSQIEKMVEKGQKEPR